MAAQTVPALPTLKLAVSAAFSLSQERAVVDQLVTDLVLLRNTVDALTTLFNAHTHLCGGNGVVSSIPDSTAAGKTGAAPSASTAPDSVLSAV